MTLHHRLLQATALSFTLASCATPFSGINPVGTTGQAPAGPIPGAPAAGPGGASSGPGVSAPALGGPSLPPAPPLAAEARSRLMGSVFFNDQAVANATLTAIDLSTGQAIALRAWSETGNGATGTQRTDAKGAFDCELPKLADDQLVKLVATAGSQTFTALFDARGRAVGAAGAQGASYQLAQGQAVSITIRLKLTAATTAAAKAFEGALKLTFQLPAAAREAERAAALAAAEQAAKEVEAALARKPELAADLVVSVGANGEVQDVDAFRSAVAKLGVFDTVFAAVQGRLQAVTAQKLTADGKLAAITAEDFPLDRVTISKDGGFSFTGGSVGALGGSLTTNFVPTPERNRRRAAPTQQTEPMLPYLTTFLHVKELVYLGGGKFLLSDAAPAGNASALYTYDIDTKAEELIIPNANLSGVVDAIGFCPQGSATSTIIASIKSTTGYTFKTVNLTDGSSSEVYSVPATPITGSAASGRTSFYWALTYWGVLNEDVAMPKPAGNLRGFSMPARVLNPKAMTVHDDGVATPTVFYAQDLGASLTVLVAQQEGGASRTLAVLPNTDINALAVASPSLYAASNVEGAEMVFSVDVDSLATSVFVSKTGGLGTHKLAFQDQLYGLTLDEADSPKYLYFAARPASGATNQFNIWRVDLP